MPMQQPPQFKSAAQWLAATNEQVWLQLGALSELMGELDGATQAYERAMNFNQWSVPAMLAISCILRSKDQFTAAVEYLRQILKIEANNGEVWSSLGHCYLMMDDLQQAYSAYQQALYHLPDPKEPKLWYGIGILYDRYGSLEHAEEAFSQVMRMEPNFEKANEIYFRLGIIYKQQQKFQQSLEVRSPNSGCVPPRLTCAAVLPLHRRRPATSFERGRYLVPDWPRARAAKRRQLCSRNDGDFPTDMVTVRLSQSCLHPSAGARSQPCQSLTAAGLATPSTEHKLQQPRAGHRVSREVR